jgi:hypothetical protein
MFRIIIHMDSAIIILCTLRKDIRISLNITIVAGHKFNIDVSFFIFKTRPAPKVTYIVYKFASLF